MHNPETVDSDIRTLADQLGVAEDEDEDLNQKEQFRVPESCEWLLGDDSFIKWRDRESDHETKPSPIYLLSGDPGINTMFKVGCAHSLILCFLQAAASRTLLQG